MFLTFLKDRAKLNNKYLKSYGLKQPMKYIMYLDGNNWFGYAISKFLPTGGFKLLDCVKFNLDYYDDKSFRGCILEVELEYFKQLYELQNDYLLASDNLKITKKMFFDYRLKIGDNLNISIGKVEKLVSTISNKEKYIFYYVKLELYVWIELKIKKSTWCTRIWSINIPKTIYRN